MKKARVSVVKENSAEFERKYQKAIEELKRSSIWKSNYQPPAYRLGRKLGIQARPPHYNLFLFNTVRMSVYFGLMWCLFMFIFKSRNDHTGVASILTWSVSVGLFFGFTMAIYYWYSFRTQSLTAWDDL